MNRKKLLLLPLLTCILAIHADESSDEKYYNMFSENQSEIDNSLTPSSYEEARQGTHDAKKTIKTTTVFGAEKAKNFFQWVADTFQENQNENVSQLPSDQLPSDQLSLNQEIVNEAPIAHNDTDDKDLIKLIEQQENLQDEILNTKIDKNLITPSNHFKNTFGRRFATGLAIDKAIRLIMPQASAKKKRITSLATQTGVGFFLFDRQLSTVLGPIENNAKMRRALALYALKAGITYLGAHKFNDALNIATEKLATFIKNR